MAKLDDSGEVGAGACLMCGGEPERHWIEMARLKRETLGQAGLLLITDHERPDR